MDPAISLGTLALVRTGTVFARGAVFTRIIVTFVDFYLAIKAFVSSPVTLALEGAVRIDAFARIADSRTTSAFVHIPVASCSFPSWLAEASVSYDDGVSSVAPLVVDAFLLASAAGFG